MKAPSTNERLTGKRGTFACITEGTMNPDAISNDDGAHKEGLAERLCSHPSSRQ